MKNILKNLFTSKKSKQKSVDESYAELDRILKLKKAEHDAATAKKAAAQTSTKKVPVKNVTVTVTKTVKTPTAKKPTAKKK